MRRLNFSTESRPFTPKFQPNFQSKRGSVVRRMRMASAGNIGQVQGAYGVPALAGKMRPGDRIHRMFRATFNGDTRPAKAGTPYAEPSLRLLSKNVRFRIVLMKISSCLLSLFQCSLCF